MHARRIVGLTRPVRAAVTTARRVKPDSQTWFPPGFTV